MWTMSPRPGLAEREGWQTLRDHPTKTAFHMAELAPAVTGLGHWPHLSFFSLGLDVTFLRKP